MDMVFDKLSIEGNVETAYQMWSTLGGTGIVASSLTNFAKSQRAGLSLQKGVEINFEGLNTNQSISLSTAYDLNGNSGTVDASDPKRDVFHEFGF